MSRRPMPRAKQLVLLASVLVLGFGAYHAARLYRTWRLLPEAYAAWDSGTLIVDYMKVEGQWPSSWHDLSEFLAGDEENLRFILRGSTRSEWPEYIAQLPDWVSIDWSYDPEQRDGGAPVSRASGGSFPVLWEGGDPNEIVQAYLSNRAAELPPPGANTDEDRR